MKLEEKLTNSGVFKGAHGLRGLANAGEFWQKQPYGTRLYYGDNIDEYLHIDILRAAINLLDHENAKEDKPSQGEEEFVK